MVAQKTTSNTGSTPVASGSKLTAVMNGDSFISIQSGAIISDSAIVINGADRNGNRIELIVKNTKNAGVYPITSATGHSASFRAGAQEPYIADSLRGGGQIRVIAVDTVNQMISGVFSFEGERLNGSVKAITGGEFKLPYTLDLEPIIDENDTVYSTNPKKLLSLMSAIVGTDTIDFEFTESFMYLGNVHLSGYNDDNERIVIACSPDAAAGNISLAGNFGPNSAYYRSPFPNSLAYAAVSGQSDFTITLNDKTKRHMVGTFNFMGKVLGGGSGTKNVNNGVLDFYY